MSLKAFYTNQGHHYEFNGPFTSLAQLLPQSGVYLISTKSPDGSHKVIDVGESHDVKTRVTSHDRRQSWQPHAVDQLYVSTFYCDEPSRMTVESNLRTFHNPPCGVR